MAAWLDLLSDVTGRSLVDTGRFEEIIQGMSHPNSQYPSFIYFAGNGNRIKALQALFPHNNVTRKGPTGLIRIHLSTTTAHTEHPILFAESNPFSQAGILPWTQVLCLFVNTISEMQDVQQLLEAPSELKKYPT
ncbi:uncharacterized protein N7518_004446 [Penicillium psychrosexuale]|uniref:uncharacterized protein n=1 Tax=Penicillium psychrosexuale TaxID=1002107 RepID=UPI002545790A|nr:uncharacterized protein N7518_004446 [Penicillium psychrosexuale]KAJ5795906.1 hypothetical protein N7518_004446 [Penicillium psychrosexuale]